jgi:hypothetical protein
MSNGCGTNPANGINTNFGDRHAYWYADLQKPYHVGYISIQHSTSSPAWERMGNIVIYVDSKEFYTFPTYYQDLLRRIVEREYIHLGRFDSIKGRYFTFQKYNDINVPNHRQFLDINEIMLWACPSGMFGNPMMQSCKQCGACRYFCDNVFGCTNDLTKVLTNAAIKRDDKITSSSGLSDISKFEFKYLNDGLGDANRGSMFCFKSHFSTSLPKFFRFELDGLWLVHSVVLHAFPSEENTPMSYTIVATRKVANIKTARQADDVVCWERNGSLGNKLEQRYSFFSFPVNMPILP